MGTARQAQTAQACEGVWVGKERQCLCPEGFMLNTPACEEADCLRSGVLVLKDNGQSASFTMQRSPSARRLSAIGPRVSRGQWSITSEQELKQVFSKSEHVTPVDCEGDSLVQGGGFHYIKAGTDIGNAILTGLETKELTDVSY